MGGGVNVGEIFTFNCTGAEQTWVVPNGCTRVRIECWGAQGQNYSTNYQGGKGGHAAGILDVTPGETLYVYVGASPNVTGRFNGGGDAWRAGGGASDVRQGGSALENRKIVAGGGGGAGFVGSGRPGGGGGGESGEPAPLVPGEVSQAQPGTQISGGAGGQDYYDGGSGSFGQGGDGFLYSGVRQSGGGGGGWYGGGAGAVGANGNDDFPGAGGSGYIGGVYDAYMETAVQINDGLVTIEVLNAAPDAPTLTTPADGAKINRQQDQTFVWQHNDQDPGDSQSAYNWMYRPVDAATWTETGWVAVGTSQHTATANTFAEGLHEWRVATKDQAGAESPWSITRTFTAYKAGSGSALLQVSSQATATGTVAYHLDGVGVISVAHTRSAQGIKSTAGTGLAEQDVLPVVSSGLRASRGTATIEAEHFVGIFSSGIGSGALLVTATPLASGTRQTQGDGLLYVTDVPTSTGHKWQRYFTPPGREVYGNGSRFWRRVHIEQGVTVIKRDGAFIQVEHPSADDFANADKIYIGGHLYQIDDLEHLDLEAAGYTTFYSEDGT